MESEPARVPGLAANECAGDTVRFDFFFIITGDMVYYLTPVEEIAGLTEVSLNTLQHRKVSNLLMAA